MTYISKCSRCGQDNQPIAAFKDVWDMQGVNILETLPVCSSCITDEERKIVESDRLRHERQNWMWGYDNVLPAQAVVWDTAIANDWHFCSERGCQGQDAHKSLSVYQGQLEAKRKRKRINA